MRPGIGDAWRNGKAKKFRFRARIGNALNVPRMASQGEELSKPTGLPGELLTLAKLGRKRLDSKRRKLGERILGAV